MDRRHQSAFLKKRFCIHHVPPARAADKNPTNVGNKKENKERIMPPESSMDTEEISIQKLKEACEMVTITKQGRHIFLNETKRTLKRGFTSSKVR